MPGSSSRSTSVTATRSSPSSTPVNHTRLPALLPSRDDHLSLQLPRRQDRSLSAAVGLRQDRSGRHPHRLMKEPHHGRDPLATRGGDPRPSGSTPPRRQQEGPRAYPHRHRSHQRSLPQPQHVTKREPRGHIPRLPPRQVNTTHDRVHRSRHAVDGIPRRCNTRPC